MQYIIDLLAERVAGLVCRCLVKNRSCICAALGWLPHELTARMSFADHRGPSFLIYKMRAPSNLTLLFSRRMPRAVRSSGEVEDVLVCYHSPTSIVAMQQCSAQCGLELLYEREHDLMRSQRSGLDNNKEAWKS